ncbi:MAG: PAS domain-containing sensor histidine kinase [Clostridia bacterium]|nr:PAS domain-containing sensor histidine kinase [Clostridia bacterium]
MANNDPGKRRTEITAALRAKFRNFSFKDFLVTFGVYVAATLIGFFFNRTASDPTLNIAMLYTVGAFVAARYTDGYFYGILYAFIAVVSVNYFFTYPYGNIDFSLQGYQVTFLGMLIISIITSISSTVLKTQQELLAKQDKELMEAEKEKMRANLLRAVSHDIRTPLTGIIGNSESIIENPSAMDEAEKVQLVTNIDRDARWLLDMVENLLSVTRIDEKSSKVKKTPEIVDEVVSTAVSQFRKSFPDAKVTVKVPDDPVMAEMDPMLIQQVLINILNNAKIHSGTEEPIELEVRVADGNVLFSVRDHGRRIPEERLESIFDGGSFGTEEESPDSTRGMGIGLSICKTIIDAHDGTIKAVDHEDGVEFVFTLPEYLEEMNDAEGIDTFDRG